MEIASSAVNAMVISIAVVLVIIILCMALFYIQKKNSAKIFLLGMLGYLIPQILLRYPLISWMQINVFPFMNVYIVMLLLSGSAAFMETLGRYLVIKYALRYEQTRWAGIVSGLGHGVCEMIFLLAVMYINNLFIVYLAQLGGNSTQIQLVLAAVNEVPIAVFYFTLLERCFYIIIQTALSSIMMNGIIKKRSFIFLFVFLLHFLMDIIVTCLSDHGVTIQTICTILFVLVIIAVLYIWKSEQWLSGEFEKKQEKLNAEKDNHGQKSSINETDIQHDDEKERMISNKD